MDWTAPATVLAALVILVAAVLVWTAIVAMASEAATTPFEAMLMASTALAIRLTARWVAPTESSMASSDAPA